VDGPCDCPPKHLNMILILAYIAYIMGIGIGGGEVVRRLMSQSSKHRRKYEVYESISVVAHSERVRW
jgi:hypothetical protein